MTEQVLKTIGHSVMLTLPGMPEEVPAKVDTGASLSALWVSEVAEEGESLNFVLFDASSRYYSGEVLSVERFETRTVTSSNGGSERRYVIDLPITFDGTTIVTRFTLTDRATMMYPILLGRHFMKGKFIVNVADGLPHEFIEKLKLHKETRIQERNNSKEAL